LKYKTPKIQEFATHQIEKEAYQPLTAVHTGHPRQLLLKPFLTNLSNFSLIQCLRKKPLIIRGFS